MATTPEEVQNSLAMPGMTVRAPWTPDSGRDPTPEELTTYYSGGGAETPEAIEAPYQAPAELPAAPVEEAWTPDSDRDPTSDELAAFYTEPEPEVIAEPVPPTPEEALRQTPGIAGFQSEEYLAAKNEEMRALLGEEPTAPDPPTPAVTQLEPEIEPWDPDSGESPSPEQLRQYTGMSAADAPVRAIDVNPINLQPAPLDESVGRTRTALGNAVQSAGKLLSSVPKAVQLWFAPDTELLEWMDEMDRMDADPNTPKHEKAMHISLGMQNYGTMVNVFSSQILDKYIEGPKNKGETLTTNRAEARAQFLDEMRKTVDRPLYKAGEAFDQGVRESFPTNPEYQDEWLASKIPSGLGSVVGYMTVFALTKKPAAAVTEGMLGPTVAATTTTAGIGVTTQQAFAFEDALTSGAEIDEAFDAAFSGYTVASGMSEALPISRFFGRADAATGGAIKKTLIRMFKQGTEEGLQEGFQDIMGNLTAQELYDPERQLWGVDTTGEAAAVGFTTGALVEFIASMFPGRRRGAAGRGEPTTETSLQDQIQAARDAAAAEGGDALDQAEAASRVAAGITPEMREQQEATKERILADREARVERNAAGEPLAGLVQAESDIARLPFEQQAAVVARAVAEEIAAAKQLAFERTEAEAETQKAEEVKEAEYQKELQVGEAQEEVGAALDVAEEVQAEAKAPKVADIVEPEVKVGLEKMKAAKIAAREAAGKVGEAVEAAAAAPIALEDQRADFVVTPEGEAIPRAEQEGRLPRQPSPTAEDLGPALPGELPVAETNAIVAAKAEAAATSPTNNIPEPTEAQVEAGNYAKGHLTAADTGIPGVDITIENPAGSTRSGTDAAGNPWTQKMRDHYGYIKRTESAEGQDEQLDVFVGESLDSDLVFVVDQVDQNTGEFDEHKVMMGYANQMDAVRSYKRNYQRKWKVGPVTVMTREQFAGWLERGDQTKPVDTSLRGAAPAADVEAIARAQGQVVRFRADEGVPGPGASAAAQAGMEVTPRAEPEVAAPVTEPGYDFAGMTRSDRASLATHLVEQGYGRLEAQKAIADMQAGKIDAIDDANVQSWIKGRQPKVVRVKDAKAAVKPITDELTQLKPVIVTDPADTRVPETLQRLMRDRRAMRAKGAYFNGKLYIFANNHETTEDIVRTLLHEGVAHQGLRALFKNDTELNAILDEVYGSMTDAEIETMRSRSRAYANIDLTTEAGQRELAEEHIAHLAETDPQQTVIQRLVAAVRSMLRSVGLTQEFTNDDIVALLADARRELRKTVPLNRINVVSQVEVAETGEVIEVEERADKVLRQLEKRMGVIQTLRGCTA